MRKIITMLTALFLFTSCKSYAKEVIKENNNVEKRVLVAYFSYAGTTKRYAEKMLIWRAMPICSKFKRPRYYSSQKF